MGERNDRGLVYSPLLTDTLPYEVPVIFSNDRFYFTARSDFSAHIELHKNLKKVLLRSNKPTIPYRYRAIKDEFRYTQLSIGHPLWQLQVCDFYAKYERSLLAYCSRSEFSLRHPISTASRFTETKVEKNDVTVKIGAVQIDPALNEKDLPHVVSHFVYFKYHLLSKFVESPEFIRLERRFSVLRVLDISNCFHNIYTHAIGWSVKSRATSKKYLSAYSFEDQFDRLMRRANEDETHGILVGPEVSRIFAEVLLQGIDDRVKLTLKSERLINEEDYAIRRYVDDFFVFCQSIEHANIVEKIIGDVLREYKLFINNGKTNTFRRPFMSPISMARADLRSTFDRAKVGYKELLESPVPSLNRLQLELTRNVVMDIRKIVSSKSISFATISGWIMATLRRLVQEANRALLQANSGEEMNAKWYEYVKSVLSIAIYVCATDIRVRTTYSLCQLISLCLSGAKAAGTEITARVQYLLASYLDELLAHFPKLEEESVELYNLLICGAHYLPDAFLASTRVQCILDKLLGQETRYFSYITLKFCFLKDKSRYAASLDVLNRKVRGLIEQRDIREAEIFLLLCDYLSAPDLDAAEKVAIFTSKFKGTISKQAVEDLGQRLGFVDWSAMLIDHTLRRKQLRPAYRLS